jgi:ubiquitin
VVKLILGLKDNFKEFLKGILNDLMPFPLCFGLYGFESKGISMDVLSTIVFL